MLYSNLALYNFFNSLSREIMLKHHLLFPHYSKQHNSEYIHYLSLGSHVAPYLLDNIAAFSIVTLHKNQKIPEIHNNDNKSYRTVVIPLKGTLKIGGNQIKASAVERQVINDPFVISNEGEESATFAYIGFFGQQEMGPRIQISRIGQNLSKVQLKRQLFYLLSGKLSFREREVDVLIKSNGQFQQSMPALYAVEPIEIQLQANSVYLTISDNV